MLSASEILIILYFCVHVGSFTYACYPNCVVIQEYEYTMPTVFLFCMDCGTSTRTSILETEISLIRSYYNEVRD